MRLSTGTGRAMSRPVLLLALAGLAAAGVLSVLLALPRLGAHESVPAEALVAE